MKKRYSFPLRAGHKHAYLCTENTTYRYMVDMDAAKAWFIANVEKVVRLYGIEHNIQREDVFLGKTRAPRVACRVSITFFYLLFF